MNIVLISAEASPYAKEGGLADIASSLPKAWNALGHTPIIILPKYKSINTDLHSLLKTDIKLSVSIGNWTESANVWKGFLDKDKTIAVYFIENSEYYERDGIYGDPEGYNDNDRRFLFLSRAAFELCIAINFKPDIMHAHDYHAALVMPLLKIQYHNHPYFNNTAGVFTLHNLAYQGWYRPESIMELAGWGLERFYKGSWFELHGTFNAMKAGIMFADKITTVSPTYANEIRWTELGEGLQQSLHERSDDLIGILNGVDYDEWNPETDLNLEFPYSSSILDTKALNKQTLFNEFSIPYYDREIDLPIIGMVSRFTFQKGIELLEESIESFIAHGAFRLLILGSGEPRYEQFFRYLQEKYPHRVMIKIGYNNGLSHRVIATSDYLLVPSLFEPCGLTQMYALKYGTIPIVRSTGGLADTVEEYNPSLKSGTGFCFSGFQSSEFISALRRALSLYKSEEHWDIIRNNAMQKDFSALHSGTEYIKVFEWALEKTNRTL